MLAIAITQPIATYTIPDWLQSTGNYMKNTATAPVTILSATIGSIGYIAYKWRMNKCYQEVHRAIGFGWAKDTHEYNGKKIHQHGDKIKIADEQICLVHKEETKSADNLVSRIYHSFFPRPYARTYTFDECRDEYARLNGPSYSSMDYEKAIDKIKTNDSWDAIIAETKKEELPAGMDYINSLQPKRAPKNETDTQKIERLQQFMRFKENQKYEYDLIQHLTKNKGFSHVDALEVKRLYKEYSETRHEPDGVIIKELISSIKMNLNDSKPLQDRVRKHENGSTSIEDIPLEDCLAYIATEINKLDDPGKPGSLSNAIKSDCVAGSISKEQFVSLYYKRDALYFLHAQYWAEKNINKWCKGQGSNITKADFLGLVNDRTPTKRSEE
jgi:hypothetical protein